MIKITKGYKEAFDATLQLTLASLPITGVEYNHVGSNTVNEFFERLFTKLNGIYELKVAMPLSGGDSLVEVKKRKEVFDATVKIVLGSFPKEFSEYEPNRINTSTYFNLTKARIIGEYFEAVFNKLDELYKTIDPYDNINA